MRGALPSGLALVIGLTLPAAAARAQSFVQTVSEDACDQARAFDADDQSGAAQHARRACRLERFEYRLAAERRQAAVAEEQSHGALLQAWMETTQPIRAQRPVALSAFAGLGLSAYGLSAGWNVLRRLELDLSVGWRRVTSSDFISDTARVDYRRRAIGGGFRWMMSDRDLSLFVGGGLMSSSTHLQALTYNPSQAVPDVLTGSARAHSLTASAGLQLAVKQGLRMSLEYVYAYTYYTGANLDDQQQTPSEALRVAWRDSIDHDRHGLRFEMGYAF